MKSKDPYQFTSVDEAFGPYVDMDEAARYHQQRFGVPASVPLQAPTCDCLDYPVSWTYWRAHCWEAHGWDPGPCDPPPSADPNQAGKEENGDAKPHARGSGWRP